jgi:putative transposase
MHLRRPYTQLFCHLVWATWDRMPMISEALEPRLYGAMCAKIRELGCSPIIIGGVEDHVHCLVRFTPTIAIATLVQQTKGASSHLMTHEVTGSADFKWQGGYGAFSLALDDVPRVRTYIERQKQHHAQNDLRPELERIWLPDAPESITRQPA